LTPNSLNRCIAGSWRTGTGPKCSAVPAHGPVRRPGAPDRRRLDALLAGFLAHVLATVAAIGALVTLVLIDRALVLGERLAVALDRIGVASLLVGPQLLGVLGARRAVLAQLALVLTDVLGVLADVLREKA